MTVLHPAVMTEELRPFSFSHSHPVEADLRIHVLPLSLPPSLFLSLSLPCDFLPVCPSMSSGEQTSQVCSRSRPAAGPRPALTDSSKDSDRDPFFCVRLDGSAEGFPAGTLRGTLPQGPELWDGGCGSKSSPFFVNHHPAGGGDPVHRLRLQVLTKAAAAPLQSHLSDKIIPFRNI